MRFPAALIAIVALTSFAHAQDQGAQPILGRVEGRSYASPTGAFKVVIPVLPELGGTITDTPNVVTFQDDFNVHISIAAFPQDATQRWEMTTRGLKDYLVYFFSNYVLSDFKQSFEGASIESAKFVPSVMDGELITYILLPGGSMFMDKLPLIAENAAPPIAKRANALFVKNGHIFVISVELAERVLERSTYKKTVAEEDEILRQRLVEAVARITFPKPAPIPPPSAPAIPPSLMRAK
jgi:hypothetical protein